VKRTLTIGTRGSLLARTQTERVAAALRHAHPGLVIRTVTIRTMGDRDKSSPLANLGGTGLFTKEIEEALLRETVDVAVHSMKDLTTQLPEGLRIGGVTERADPRDALLTPDGRRWDALCQGATVGTSSPRRQAQLRALRRDLQVVELRGNLETRMRRVAMGELDAAVVACAGLERMKDAGGRAHMPEHGVAPFDIAEMLPAVGQGALAVEIREDDAGTQALLDPLVDHAALAETMAERALLRALGGGCLTPLGANARADEHAVRLTACVCALDGSEVLRAEAQGPIGEPEALGKGAAEDLLSQGARRLVDAAHGR
jgi:hydroxymethylbilane synthase